MITCHLVTGKKGSKNRQVLTKFQTCPESKQHVERKDALGLRLWFSAYSQDFISTQYTTVVPIASSPNVSCSPWFNHTFPEVSFSLLWFSSLTFLFTYPFS